jgi:hypothetical protein
MRAALLDNPCCTQNNLYKEYLIYLQCVCDLSLQSNLMIISVIKLVLIIVITLLLCNVIVCS